MHAKLKANLIFYSKYTFEMIDFVAQDENEFMSQHC